MMWFKFFLGLWVIFLIAVVWHYGYELTLP